MKKVMEPYYSDVVILTGKREFLSSYFRSRARKGPGTEEQGSPVAGPVCDRSSPGQDRRRLQHEGRIRIFGTCSFILQYCRFQNCKKKCRNWIKVESTNTNRFTIYRNRAPSVVQLNSNKDKSHQEFQKKTKKGKPRSKCREKHLNKIRNIGYEKS
jgi:hypothetical protein